MNSVCDVHTWTFDVPEIAPCRGGMTDRAARWVTAQVGKSGRSVSEVAAEIGCDWHTVNDAVQMFGEALLADPDRIGNVVALGLDETLFVREGPRHQKRWSTSIVDSGRGVLLDMIEERTAKACIGWLSGRSESWLKHVRWGTLDLSGPYRLVFDTMLAHAGQIADPFHVVRLANQALDETRRRVQNETLGHRGHKTDPLYRCRRLLTKADERLDENGRSKLLGLLGAGDPKGEVKTAWHAKEVVRDVYTISDPGTADMFVARLAVDLQDQTSPPEVRRLGRTLGRWHPQICNWHRAHTKSRSFTRPTVPHPKHTGRGPRVSTTTTNESASSLTPNTFTSGKPTSSSHIRVGSSSTGAPQSGRLRHHQTDRAPVPRHGSPHPAQIRSTTFLKIGEQVLGDENTYVAPERSWRFR